MKRLAAGLGLIELLVSLVIIAFVFAVVMKYYAKRSAVYKETQKALSEQGVDTKSYSSIMGSVKKTLETVKDSRQGE